MDCTICGSPMRELYLNDVTQKRVGYVCVNEKCYADAGFRAWITSQNSPHITDFAQHYERLKEWMVREFKNRINLDFEFTEEWAHKATELGYSFRKTPREAHDYRSDTGTQLLQHGEVVAEFPAVPSRYFVR